MKNQHFAILADDFTGANDTGVQFSKKGLSVRVISDCSVTSTDSDILVINTETRVMDKDVAKSTIKITTEQLLSQNYNKIYKKIDSTYRGNIGIEIETLANSCNRTICVMAPALPSQNRVLIDGISFVNGIQLHLSSFSKDPIHPITNSSVSEIIQEQTSMKIQSVSIKDICTGAFQESFTNALNTNLDPLIFLCDSTQESDLIAIAEIIYPYLDKIVCIGSAGLANALSEKLVGKDLNLNKSVSSEVVQNSDIFTPICFVVGSVSQIIYSQVKYLKESCAHKITHININKENFFSEDLKMFESIHTQVKDAIDKKNHILLIISETKQEKQECINIAINSGIPQADIPEFIARVFGEIVKQIVENYEIRSLFLTGGNTAIHVMRSLKCLQVDIHGEIVPGVPYGVLADNQLKLPMATKAGGFGTLYTLKNIIEFYEGDQIYVGNDNNNG